MQPVTQYAKSGDVHIAYQAFGDGQVNLVIVPGFVSNVESYWDQPDYARFLNIAEGSLAELEYLLILSRDLGYAEPDRVEPVFARVAEVARMLHGLRVTVQRRK